MNSIIEAQKDMNDAYFYGIPGVISSGSIWFLSGLAALLFTPKAGITALIFAGMLIFPISVLLCKLFGRRGKHKTGNPLAPLALEGTFWMLLSIPIAVGAACFKLEWFFPSMLLVIGGRYLTFSTIYGNRIFWVFGGVLACSSIVLAKFNVAVFIGGVIGGVIELLFALFIFIQVKGSNSFGSGKAASDTSV